MNKKFLFKIVFLSLVIYLPVNACIPPDANKIQLIDDKKATPAPVQTVNVKISESTVAKLQESPDVTHVQEPVPSSSASISTPVSSPSPSTQSTSSPEISKSSGSSGGSSSGDDSASVTANINSEAPTKEP